MKSTCNVIVNITLKTYNSSNIYNHKDKQQLEKDKSFNMAGIKCRYYSKVYKTTCEMTKHLSTYKLRQGTVRYTVSRKTLYKIKHFSMAKAEVMLSLVEPISKEKSPYTDAPDRRDPTSINTKILERIEVTKMPKVKNITPKSKYTIFNR